MRYTENLNLKKPEQTEFYDVDDFNENADIIDIELMNRLKVTGGEMTGSITVKNTEILHRDVNNSFLTICGGKNWRDGAYAILHGSTADEKGVFNLGSYDGNLEVNLIGKPTGELTWNSKNIVRSINDIPANVDGDVRITTVDNLVIESMPIGQGKTIGELKTALLAWLKRTQGVTAQCMFTADNAWSEHWTDNSYVLKAGSLWTVTSIGNITTHVQAYAHLMFASYASPTVFTATVVESAFTQFKMLGDVNSVNNIRPDGNGNITLPVATAEKYGLVRVAEPTDVLDTVNDAAITPAVYHDVSDFRHKGTAYSLGDKVECMFNHELFLECTKAGTTASTPLDTRNVKHGQVLTDGGVQWTVRTHIKSVNGVVAGADGDVKITIPKGIKDLSISGKTITVTFDDESTKQLTTQDTIGIISNAFVGNAENGYTKLSNGLQLVWGKVNTVPTNITFGRAFATKPIVLPSLYTTAGTGGVAGSNMVASADIGSITTTGCRLCCYDSSTGRHYGAVSYVIIGKGIE